MTEIYLLVHIEVMPGKANEQIEAYKKLKPLVLAEPGCIQYQLLSDEQNENKFVLIEKWTSQAALDAHNQTAHMLAADAHSPTFRAKAADVVKIKAVT